MGDRSDFVIHATHKLYLASVRQDIEFGIGFFFSFIVIERTVMRSHCLVLSLVCT